MRTSNWQHILFFVELLMKIEPKRVLDVGVGFGRWGVVVREFCDVWFGRVLPEQWSVYIEGVGGVEDFDSTTLDYYQYFYNEIHTGDALEIVPKMDAYFDVIIFGDVIKHFTHEDAKRLLEWSVTHSDYVVINVTLFEERKHDEIRGNSDEYHQISRITNDLSRAYLVKSAIFDGHTGQKYGSFVLSRNDTRNVSQRLFSVGSESDAAFSFEQEFGTMEDISRRVHDLVRELETIKQSRGYQSLVRLRRSIPGRTAVKAMRYVERYYHSGLRNISTARQIASKLIRRASVQTSVFLLNQSYPLRSGFTRLRIIGRNTQSQGSEAWILAVRNDRGFLAPDEIRLHGFWNVRDGLGLKGRAALVASDYGWADIPANDRAHLMLLRHPWSGVVELQTHNKRRVFDLYAAQASDIIIDLTTLEQKSAFPSVCPITLSDSVSLRFERIDLHQEVVAVVNPSWKGIYSSTRNLFDNILEISDDLSEGTGLAYARLIASTNCRVVVIQGFPLTYYHLVTALRRIAPKVRIAVIWHGTFLQLNEDYERRSFYQVERLYRDGIIWKWGFVKARMAEIMANRGIRSGFVQNMVREIPDSPSKPLQGGPHIGMWLLSDSSWRKNPLASIASISVFPSAVLHLSGVSDLSREFIQFLGIQDGFLQSSPIDQASIRSYLAQMHLNLYVTLSECAPMLPLESLSVGAPCLFGPTTYYFEDNEYLRERLVVPQPDDAGLIARYIGKALEERDDIVNAYIKYAPDYNRRSRRLLAEFLELDVNDNSSSNNGK